MEVIRLEFQPQIKDKLLEFLSSFSSEELKIVREDPFFEENKNKLEASLEKINNGTAKLYKLEELDQIVREDPFFEENKNKLEAELANIKNGTAEFCSLDELDLMMDEIFAKNDNKIK